MRRNLTGEKFGQWEVLGPGPDQVGPYGHRVPRWRVRCTCGTESLVIAVALTSGRSYRCRACANQSRKSPNSPK